MVWPPLEIKQDANPLFWLVTHGKLASWATLPCFVPSKTIFFLPQHKCFLDLACSRLQHCRVRWIKKARTRKKYERKWGEKGRPFSFFPPRQRFVCLSLSRLPHYLRAWNRLLLAKHVRCRWLDPGLFLSSPSIKRKHEKRSQYVDGWTSRFGTQRIMNDYNRIVK